MKPAAAQRTDALVYGAIALMMPVIFVVDLRTPLGFAEWVLYVAPCALAYLASRPLAPIGTAVIATALMIAGFYLSPPGADPTMAGVNRIMGGTTAWVLAATGYFFIRNKLAVRRQEWLQSGQVGLSEVVAGEQTVTQLGDAVLRYAAEYVGADAALIYVREGNEFVRHGAYGVPGDERIPARIAPGEGLIGQAVRDRRAFVLENVPDNVLYFGSGLMRGKPGRILIAPAIVDGEVIAVLEFGFRGEAGQRAPELVERVGDAVAVAIRSARYRERLQEFLEETQRQAEELQNQSDELRATNEELEEQSRALQDSQTRLEHQQAELEQTNVQLEEQTQLLEAQRDDLSRAQAELQQQARALEQASRYKSEFLANMSHELRTPLNSLLIMARLLADNRAGNLTAEQIRFAETIETAGNDLLALINDVLDIAKIEAGRLELQPTRVRVAHMAEKLIGGLRALAQQKGLSLRTEFAAGAPTEVETDPQRLEQVLKNFLSNAVKFTERGEVVLSVARAPDGKVAFTVRDTGIGIAPDQQEAVFDAFRQADGTISRKYGGTGLGLSISRELAGLLGGEIHLDSAVGRGSAFTLLIPETFDPALTAERAVAAASPPALILEEHAPEAPSLPAPKPRPGRVTRRIDDDRETLRGDARTILVVEDDVAFARILCDLAHELGFQCIHAETADEGITAVRQYLPSAVVLDVGLPDHSGLSVLDRIKHDVRTRHIPVHVVSVSDYTQTAMALGAMSYMMKPVKREELASALERLETGMAQRVRRVLIVEDDAAQLESIRSLLASRDVETLGARTAAECLQQLKETTFDCMVVDLSLPDMSGFDLLAKLSDDDSFAFPPVIVYTGRDLSSDEEMRLRKFSKSIIIKGAKSPERLLDEVTLFLHQVVSDLPEQQQKMLAKSLNRDAALEGRRVLVVEDDVRNVFAITAIFEPHGVDLHIARNGVEALQALQQAADGAGPIDLVLMDIMMPEMDGLTCMREIRSRPEWRDLPIIALTAKAMQADQEKCMAAGANDYLSKPLDVDKLVSLVRVWMPR